MSAIFGIINKTGKPIDGKAIQKMQEALMHRATDGSGTWHLDNIFLGHHQLAITLEQSEERLPVEEDDLVITSDARIDNRDDLLHRLKCDLQDHRVFPDSYLILAAYQKWDAKCVDYMEGEFAFAIWNKRTHKLFCAVDHIGFRPLFY